MSAQEFQTCMRIPKLCSLQGWKTTQLTLEDSSAQSSNWRAFARAGDSISWSRKRTLRRLRGKGKNCDFLLNLYTHVDIFTYVYSIYANRITFDYVCVGRNEIDPKGPCHTYIYTSTLIWISYRIDVVSWVNCWWTLHKRLRVLGIQAAPMGAKMIQRAAFKWETVLVLGVYQKLRRQRVPLRSLAVKCLSDLSRCSREMDPETAPLHHQFMDVPKQDMCIIEDDISPDISQIPSIHRTKNHRFGIDPDSHIDPPPGLPKDKICNVAIPQSPLRKRQCRTQRYIWVPGLVNIQTTMENHHAINGKTHYKWI